MRRYPEIINLIDSHTNPSKVGGNTPFIEEMEDDGRVTRYLYEPPIEVVPPNSDKRVGERWSQQSQQVTTNDPPIPPNVEPLSAVQNRGNFGKFGIALGIFTPALISLILFSVNEINFIVKLVIAVIAAANAIIFIKFYRLGAFSL